TVKCGKGIAAIEKIFDSGKVDVLAWLERGDLYRCLGDVERALSDYNEAARLKPEKLQCWLSLAMLFKQTHQYEKAAAALEKALTVEPRSLLARFIIADVYQLQGAN